MNQMIIPENAMLVDIQYVRKNRKTGQEDCLYTIYKDVDTGEKFVYAMESPKIPIYVEKEEYRDHVHCTEYADKTRLTMKTVKYADTPYEVAKIMGDAGKRLIQNIQETKNYSRLMDVNLYPYVYGQDYDVRALYRFFWLKKMNGKASMRLSKSFLDIETDILSSPGMPRPKKDPIDLVSIADMEHKIVHTFMLVGREFKDVSDAEEALLPIKREERKKLYEERHRQEEKFMADPTVAYNLAHEKFDEEYPGWNYQTYFYTDEAEMLIQLFQCIHKISPDFLAIWNISFDVPYIIERLQALGLDPAEVMCDPEFLNKVCIFHRDTHNFDIKNKSDHFEVSSKTVWICQMENFAATRKGGDELRQYSLDYISKNVCKKSGKYVYLGKAPSLRTLGYVDLITYWLYNVKDVLSQVGIEEVTHDIDSLYRRSYMNMTPYENVFMNTMVLRNVQYLSYDKQGLVPGANVNRIYVKHDMEAHPEKYQKKGKKPGIEGALVGNTRLINKFGQPLYGKKTNFIFNYSIDMDMKAFYPSTQMGNNMSKSTLIFKFYLDCNKYDVRGGEIPFHGFTDVELVEDNTPSFVGDISAEVIDNFQCGNILSTGRKFLNLPSISDLVSQIKKEENYG